MIAITLFFDYRKTKIGKVNADVSILIARVNTVKAIDVFTFRIVLYLKLPREQKIFTKCLESMYCMGFIQNG